MKYGFTGNRKGTTEEKILQVINGLNFIDRYDWVITGACIGIDFQISHIVNKYYPKVHQMIIVPGIKKQIDKTVYTNATNIIFMPHKSSYRQRNEKIVNSSDKIIAFWTGQKMYSGTYMTINIAKRANKFISIIKI